MLPYSVNLSRNGDGFDRTVLAFPFCLKSVPGSAELLKLNLIPVWHPESLRKETPANLVLGLDSLPSIPNDGVVEIQGENAVARRHRL